MMSSPLLGTLYILTCPSNDGIYLSQIHEDGGFGVVRDVDNIYVVVDESCDMRDDRL